MHCVVVPSPPPRQVVHGIFEKMATAFRHPSSNYAGRYNMSWTGAGCTGSKWNDALLFEVTNSTMTYLGILWHGMASMP